MALLILAFTLRPVSQAAQATPTAITLIPGTATLEASQEAALIDTLNRAAPSLPSNLRYVAVSSLNQSGGWIFTSLTGFDQISDQKSWQVDDATWIGLALMTRSPDGVWRSEVQGTPEYETLLASIPDGALSTSAKMSLSPIRRRLAPTEAYRLPWVTGYSMQYGVLGVHDGGFAGLGDYKGVDFLSDGNTAAGHAPNQLLAAAAGAINYVCNDGINIAIRIGDLMYLHLNYPNTNLVVGRTFNQGDVLGPLRTGSFSGNCGYASQGANWFHVHWNFPNTGSFQAGGWTLQFADQLWHRGAETAGVYQWMRSESAAWGIDYFTSPNLSTPCNGALEETPYVFKQWFANPPASGCPVNTFGASFTRQVSFQGGSYALHLQRAGQARVLLDGQPLIDLWQTGDGGLDVTRTLTGVHEVQVEFAGAATLSPTLGVWWSGPGALPAAVAADPTAWRAEYYGNRTLWGQPALTQNENGAGINHPWGDASPGYGLPVDDWSARFTRDVAFACGAYQFSVQADDGARLWVGDRLLIDQWREQVADFTATADLTGTLPVKVEYFERGWGAALTVDWQLVNATTCSHRVYLPEVLGD